MLDILLGIGVCLGVGLASYAVVLARKGIRFGLNAFDEIISLEVRVKNEVIRLEAKVKDLQNILTAAPPDMIRASIIAEEWKAAMLALPEGSPKRQAYESRLKQLGVS